jgi:hypothetical protein
MISNNILNDHIQDEDSFNNSKIEDEWMTDGELIDAASNHSDSIPLEIHVENVEIYLAKAVETMKELFDSNIILSESNIMKSLDTNMKFFESNIIKSIDSNKKLIESNIMKSLNLNIKIIRDMNEDMIEHNKLESKKRTLEWAISNAEIGSFIYYENNGQYNSTDYVKKVLICFRKGYGFKISNCTLQRYFLEENKRKFREKLLTQIYDLTGVKPRTELDNDDGHYFVYFS